MTLSVCPEPGCPELTHGGRCPRHASPKWASSNRRQRLPGDWTTRRARVLRRDLGVCYVCGQPGANQVDHVQRGDNHDEANLAAIHGEPCHRLKTQREGREAKRMRRA